MERTKIVSAGLAASVLLGAGGLVACDQEDQRDLQEIGEEAENVGEEAEKEIDKLDSDGKDN